MQATDSQKTHHQKQLQKFPRQQKPKKKKRPKSSKNTRKKKNTNNKPQTSKTNKTTKGKECPYNHNTYTTPQTYMIIDKRGFCRDGEEL